jgi:hypothetical protein
MEESKSDAHIETNSPPRENYGTNNNRDPSQEALL